MSFNREKIRDFYLLTTDVENIFINEYMTAAPGDYVKVYLYGLLSSQHQREMTEQEMSRLLGLSEEEIDKAWDYWASMGIVEIRPPKKNGQDRQIEFKNLRALMYSSAEKAPPSGKGREIDAGADMGGEADKAPLYDQELKALLAQIEELLGKTLSSRDTQELYSWETELGASREVILAAASYCAEKGKTSVGYIAKVVTQWTEEGLRTEADVKARLESIEQSFARYKTVLRALGINRGVTRAEKEMIDRWFGEWGFNQERVDEACEKGSFITTPNVRYVNAILEKWYEEAKAYGRNVNSAVTVTQADLNRYYEHLRKQAEQEAEERKSEVYGRLPRIREIDQQLLELGRKISRSVLSKDERGKNEAQRLSALLEEERAVLLTENGFAEDYTDIKYSCDICHDTGVTEEGTRCSCVNKRTGEAETWLNLSSEKR